MTGLGTLLLASGCGILLYAYLVYPLAALALAEIRPWRPQRTAWLPRLSFIITAHNEEGHLARKLDNTLGLDYPSERLEVLVASDGSDDRTHEIVASYAPRGVRLIVSEGRVGKTLATRLAVDHASGELLVFSDATGMYAPDALRRLADAASDPGVGCVSGRVEYDYGESLMAAGFRLYQRLEKAVRRSESVFGRLTSLSGSIHAARRDRYPHIEPHQTPDLLLPLEMAHRGLRSVYQNEAVSLEAARSEVREEFRARVRAAILAFSYLGELRRRGWMLRDPLFAWAAVSHKVLRWFTPLWLLLLLAAHVLLASGGGVWLWTLPLHLAVYALAAAGAALPAGRVPRWLAGPVFVGTVCAAFLVGLVEFLQGRRAAAWESAR